MNDAVFQLISQLDISKIENHRKDLLQPLQEYVSQKLKENKEINLNFICTHNSRRSQLSQAWAKVIGDHYGLNINSFSGGIEVTACNELTIASLRRMGFEINEPGGENPHYEAKYDDNNPIVLFSKIHDDLPNPTKNFAAVMTCTHADKNCPFIPGAEKRISLPYEDPKAFDNTPEEAKMYDERSLQIATELKYVFSGLSI
jgi:arsenate reductase